MFDIISGIINHDFAGGESAIFGCCLALIIVFSVVLIDLIKDIFRQFWR